MDDSVLVQIFMALTALVSGATLVYLGQRRLQGTPLLEAVPRRAVPWNFWAPLMIVALMGPGIVASIGSRGAAGATAEKHADHFVVDAWTGASALLSLTVLCYVGLSAVFRATYQDLGFPVRPVDAWQDVQIGAVACAASLLPVLAVQAALQLAVQPESQHPFIEKILDDPTLNVWGAVTFSAVVAAPLFEETAFRLILQGWLEKWEDAKLAEQGRRHLAILLAEPHSAVPDGQTTAISEAQWEALGPFRPQGGPESHQLTEPEAASTPPIPSQGYSGLIPGLPHGMLPILISSVLFGLAHWGHGVDPIALTLFGLVLGYIYQRTRRITACVTAHALFNLYTMVILALQF